MIDNKFNTINKINYNTEDNINLDNNKNSKINNNQNDNKNNLYNNIEISDNCINESKFNNNSSLLLLNKSIIFNLNENLNLKKSLNCKYKLDKSDCLFVSDFEIKISERQRYREIEVIQPKNWQTLTEYNKSTFTSNDISRNNSYNILNEQKSNSISKVDNSIILKNSILSINKYLSLLSNDKLNSLVFKLQINIKLTIVGDSTFYLLPRSKNKKLEYLSIFIFISKEYKCNRKFIHFAYLDRKDASFNTKSIDFNGTSSDNINVEASNSSIDFMNKLISINKNKLYCKIIKRQEIPKHEEYNEELDSSSFTLKIISYDNFKYNVVFIANSTVYCFDIDYTNNSIFNNKYKLHTTETQNINNNNDNNILKDLKIASSGDIIIINDITFMQKLTNNFDKEYKVCIDDKQSCSCCIIY